MSTVSAVVDLQIGQATALEADAALQAFLHEAVGDPPVAPPEDDSRIYNTRAPQNTVGRYVVLGASREGRRSYYGAPGNRGGNRLHCWAEDKVAAAALYDHVARVLGAPFALPTHAIVGGVVDYLTDQPDDVTDAVQVEADFRVLTLAAA